MTDVLEDLQWRGMIALSTDLDELRKEMAKGPITYYCGFDPTAPSLHIGHLFQVLTVRRLQLAGHRPLALVGGATGLIGDPRPSAERQLHSVDQIVEWVAKMRAQIEPFLDFTGSNAARMVNNYDWTASMSAIDFLRDIGKHFRVGKMLTKDAVSARLNSDAGISYTEFSYQILQGMDFLELYRRYGCKLQTGGSDQWGNLTAGTDLIHRVEGASVHLLATPLLTNAAGEKLGKSTGGGSLWMDAELTSPYALYQYFVNLEDAIVGSLLRKLTFLEREEIEAIEKETAERPAARIGQRRLAEEMIKLVHGPEETAQVIAASQALFGRGSLGELSASTLRAALSEAGLVKAPPGSTVAELFIAAGLASSRNEARRTVSEGGAYVNNERVSDPEEVVPAERALAGGLLVLRKGKRTFAGVELASG
ncbi:tyrosine--tRNA ligase [Dactylosporangium matsuzakiense]|uniref:Tyrosine--tRNA ligase n=1 Tax=Dactylosporangium matsuzakiense TaxID=53360 RepID=A0A9W6KN57_9ACTN|nr:tyrosine--tRNA ligase [Dactylosporangium matsuzakiense]UWZ42944.1 tyrosine--tRNA ligase [Dactylosporangium matsuzakiense]GLL03260.1 tyrosine--tRNA ligase [Dactylosporangium matsuzakiense]